mmetsp:Transcript_14649/g.31835  ORF Transcript_14649/g.31835 Transcript_14649/m.31835 type:complete len:140 (+) Transcript_14649:179-598(+)
MVCCVSLAWRVHCGRRMDLALALRRAPSAPQRHAATLSSATHLHAATRVDAAALLELGRPRYVEQATRSGMPESRREFVDHTLTGKTRESMASSGWVRVASSGCSGGVYGVVRSVMGRSHVRDGAEMIMRRCTRAGCSH